MARISVAEAAERLDVGPQRVHQRIRDGSLPAERIGGRWVIEERDLARVADARWPGRPLSERSAWAILAAASEEPRLLRELSAPDRSRARARLRNLLRVADEGADPREACRLLSSALRNRAARRCFKAASPDLPDLRADRRIIRSGLSHPSSGLAAGDVVEGYLSAQDLDGLVGDYLLREVAQGRGNVILHVSALGDRPRELGDRAWHLLLAADLAQHGGPREVKRALEVLRELAECSSPRPDPHEDGSR